VLNYYILDFVYVLSKSFFSAVLHLNMSFKYNSGRVSITLQKKNFVRRFSVTKKNRFLKHRVYFTDLAEKHQYFFNMHTCADIFINSERVINLLSNGI